MNKMDRLADIYNRMKALDAARKDAEKETSNPAYRAAIRKITAGYASLLKETLAQGKEFRSMFLAYVEMQTRGSSRYEDSRCYPEKTEK